MILADNNLPDSSAMELLGTVGGTPVMLITGFGDETTAVRALHAGASDYLVKDAERHYLSSLRHRVERACIHSRAERERKRAEENLRSALLRQEAILRTSPVGVFVARDRVILQRNPMMQRMFGYEPG